MIKKLVVYLREDLWRVALGDVPPFKSFVIRTLRIVALSARRFAEDRCALRASALTFFTLLSIVPVAALAFGIAKGFGFEKTLETKVLEFVEGQEEAFRRVIDFSKNILEQTSGGVVAGFGVLLLVWSVIKLLGNIEHSFNEIWGVQKGRSLARKVSDYLSLVVIAPLLFMAAGSATVVISGEIEALAEEFAFLEFLDWLSALLLPFLPLILLWMLFAFIYVIMPNTRVRWKSALLGAVVAGSVFQLTQWGYITFQVGVSKYGAIYGSFAALPLFLIWLQLSWLIVLYGAELSFAHQHVATYEFEPDCLAASGTQKKLLSLGAARVCIERFQEGREPLTADEVAQKLGAPVRLVNELLSELVKAGVLSEVLSNGKERLHETVGYQPAVEIEQLTVQRILDLLDDRGNSSVPHRRTEQLKRLEASLRALRARAAEAEENVPLKDV